MWRCSGLKKVVRVLESHLNPNICCGCIKPIPTVQFADSYNFRLEYLSTAGRPWFW